MTTYTVKDLVLYNNPCKMCGGKSSVALIPVGKNETAYSSTIDAQYEGSNLLFNLKFTYNNRLMILINPKTNKFELTGIGTDLKRSFRRFRHNNNLMIESKCASCGTYVHSNYLDFNLDYIRPMNIFSESIVVKTELSFYQMMTDFSTNTSNIVVIKHRHQSVPAFTLQIPALSLKDIGSKERFLKKIKLYMILS